MAVPRKCFDLRIFQIAMGVLRCPPILWPARIGWIYPSLFKCSSLLLFLSFYIFVFLERHMKSHLLTSKIAIYKAVLGCIFFLSYPWHGSYAASLEDCRWLEGKMTKINSEFNQYELLPVEKEMMNSCIGMVGIASIFDGAEKFADNVASCYYAACMLNEKTRNCAAKSSRYREYSRLDAMKRINQCP